MEYDPTNQESPSFNPRMAALHHAAMIKDADLRNAATAIACGLLAVAESGDNVVSMLETLDTTVHNQLIAIAEAV
jgi:hypothetical protein